MSPRSSVFTPRVCAMCGITFHPRFGRQINCGPACMRAHKNGHTGRPLGRPGAVAPRTPTARRALTAFTRNPALLAECQRELAAALQRADAGRGRSSRNGKVHVVHCATPARRSA